MPTVQEPLLRVRGLEKRFGGIVALKDYAVEIVPGELLGLIGPNGAGKTTVFNLISGVLRPSRGQILLDGQDVTRLRPDQTVALGMARTFQNIRLFNELSVLDNIKVAFHLRLGSGLWPGLLQLPSFRRAEQSITSSAIELLDLMDLRAVMNEPAKNLPYGLQRRVEILRALATRPKLLLLDEPAAGMNAVEKQELIDTIKRIQGTHQLTIFLVEHDMNVVMSMCQRIQVLDGGTVLALGSPDDIRNDPQVIDAYLGSSATACDADT